MILEQDYITEQSVRERELPPVGVHRCVVTGVYNVGRQYDKYNDKWKPIVKLRYEIQVKNKFGNYFQVFEDYTASLHPKATLRALAHSLEGRELTDTEAASYSLRNFLGKKCIVQVIHKPKKTNPSDMKYEIANVLQGPDDIVPVGEPEFWDYRMRDRDPLFHHKASKWIWEAYTRSKDYIQPATPYVEPVRTKLGQQVQVNGVPGVATSTSTQGTDFAGDDEVPF